MRKIIVAAIMALSSGTVLAAPATKLTHRDGSITTVSGDKNGSRVNGWYGGWGGVSTKKSKAEMISEIKQAGKNKGNPVVKVQDVR